VSDEMNEIRAQVLSLLDEVGRPVSEDEADEAPLDLVSLEVVMLHDAIERAFDVRVPAKKVTPETFDSIASLVALVDEIAGEGA
jgi:acyl carrier protein